MKLWLRISGVTLLLTVLSGWSLGQNAIGSTSFTSRDQQAEQCLKEATELEKKFPPTADSPAKEFYQQYIASLKNQAAALRNTNDKARSKQTQAALAQQREAAVNCIRYGVECPYKKWNFYERKLITEYQTLITIRPLAAKAKDTQMMDFIDRYTRFLHQELATGATQNIKASVTEPENRELRQLLAATQEKINNYKLTLKQTKPEERAKLQFEGARSATPPELPQTAR